MRPLKIITSLLFSLTLVGLPAQAESKFTQFFSDLKQKGKEVLEEMADKAQESLENGRLFGLTDCTQATIKEALGYAQVIEANAMNDSRYANMEGYDIINLSTLGEPQAPEEALLSFTEKLSGHEDIELNTLSDSLINSLEYVANEHPETFLEHFFIEYDYERSIPSHTLEGFGVKARVYQPEGTQRLILSFRGTESDASNYRSRQWFNIGTDLWQGLGECSMAYEFAYCLGLALTKAFPSYKVEFTGISLGGGLAHYTAAMLRAKAICFNDPNLAKCALIRIGDRLNGDTLHLEHSITHIHIEGEILNTLMPIAPGKKLGKQCDVPTHNHGLNPLDRHHTEHLVSNLEEYLHDLAI